jgi:hypothetical protein
MLETKHDYYQFGSSPGRGAKIPPSIATPQSVAFWFAVLARLRKYLRIQPALQTRPSTRTKKQKGQRQNPENQCIEAQVEAH